jgi:AhpD family alkylhydroperoxidase
VFVKCNTTSEDEVMESRFDMPGSEIGVKFAKRFAGTSMVIQQSTLPKSTQELMALRASQINGCGWCIDMHTKEAAATGEAPVRLNTRSPTLTALRTAAGASR